MSLTDALELERNRGLQGAVPFVVDLTLQYLKFKGGTEAFQRPDKSQKRRIANHVEFLIAMAEQDKHGAVLEVEICHDYQVIVQLLTTFLRRLPQHVVPAAVYTAFMSGIQSDGEVDLEGSRTRHRLRATAAVASIKTAERNLLRTICNFLHDLPARQSAIEVLEPILCGGWEDDRNKDLRDSLN